MSDFRINPHVEELHRYVPMDAAFDRIYHEYVVADTDHPPTVELKTKAEDALLRVVENGPGVVCLTGDAGHGKTRLVCKLLEQLGMDPREAAQAVMERGGGGEGLLELPDGRSLRVVKDLSELAEDQATSLLREATASQDVYVVCANEGRLRAALDGAADLTAISSALHGSVRHGSTRVADVAILNLNFQSVAAGGESLAAQLLQDWVGADEAWAVCDGCAAKPVCPIRENRRLLADEDASSARRESLVELLRIVERIDTVVTIRDLLISSALGITGGLRCQEVHQTATEKPGSTHTFSTKSFSTARRRAGSPSGRPCSRRYASSTRAVSRTVGSTTNLSLRRLTAIDSSRRARLKQSVNRPLHGTPRKDGRPSGS